MNRLKFDTSKLTIPQLIQLRKLEYKRFEPVKCPFLGNELVYFNKDGFYHLTHDGRDRIRNAANSRMRLNLLPYVRIIIKKARFYGSPVRVIPADDRNNKFGKQITYYELAYRLVGNKVISVVLRRIGRGQLHYYSVRYYNKKGFEG